jgi:hypothetical protein
MSMSAISRSVRRRLFVLAVGVAVAAWAAAAWTQPAPGPGAAAGRCGVCHPAERVLFERSRHAQEEVRCVSCHGGDDRTLEQGSAHGAGFRGRPARTAIPGMCASCHANEQRMRAYNLPVDQYALYQTSGHGRRLAKGDTQVAVCSDCHGAHDILPPSDPASRVFRNNIPATCGSCHGNRELMKARGRPDAYAAYLSSIHARELLDQGNRNAPTCVSCHGVHGAAPPEIGDVGKVCGQCHTAERRYFAGGPHRLGMIAKGLPECASCHEHHSIEAAQPVRLSSLCGTCHGAGSRQDALGKKLFTDYQTAAAEIANADALIAKADGVPLQTEDYKARLEEARTYLREALPSAHSVHEETVAAFTVRARSVGAEIQHEIYGKLGNLRIRNFVLILFWFYVLLTIVVLRRFQRRTRRD